MAIKILRAFNSASGSAMVWGSRNLASPRNTSMPWERNASADSARAMPSITSRTLDITAAKSTFGGPGGGFGLGSYPHLVGRTGDSQQGFAGARSRSRCSRRPGATFSTRATFKPSRTAKPAAVSPAEPPPIIRKSYSVFTRTLRPSYWPLKNY